MKVLMTTDTVGGVLTYTRDLAAALRAEGVEVVVAALDGPPPEPLEGTVEWGRFALEWMPEPWDDVAAAGEWLLRIEERERPDVVHLNGYAHGALPWRAPCVVVAHSDVCSWFRAVRGVEAPPEWDRYREEVRAGLHAADAVVAIGHAVARDVASEFGASATVIHNGSPLPPVGSAKTGGAASGPLSAEGDAEGGVAAGGPLSAEVDAGGGAASPRKEHLVLGAGRVWDEAKNLAALDGAAEGLAWPVVVAGELGDAGTRHTRAAGRLSPQELGALRRRAAIFCAPARYEPFGLAILEAARDGCALVLGDIPSLRELWEGAALFADPDDPRPALARLIADDAERERLAAAARQRSLDFPVPARAYAELYATVAAGVAA